MRWASNFRAAIRTEALKDPLNAIEALEKSGKLFSGQTLAEVAQKIKVPAQALEESVKTYNANVAKGAYPQFGRNTLVASFGKPVPIEKPPFYGFPSTAVSTAPTAAILTT